MKVSDVVLDGSRAPHVTDPRSQSAATARWGDQPQPLDPLDPLDPDHSDHWFIMVNHG